MDQTIGKDPLFCETIASLFSTILYVDLRDGSCTRTSGDMQRAPCDYACFVRDFVKNYASPKKRKALMHALSLAQVKQGVQKSGRYTCFSEKLHPALYKRLSFVLCSDGHTVMLGISDFSDVAKYYRSELQEVVGFNFKDSVTCAYNRNYYEKKLKTSHLSGQVAVVDIDDFKQFNDAYGHDIGDLALKETARAILKYLSPKDVLVRYGGDEFLLFMPKSTPEEAERTLNHIRQEVGAVRHRRFGSMTLSVSIGVVSMKEEQVMDAVYRADRLMYLAKEHKNSVLTE